MCCYPSCKCLKKKKMKKKGARRVNAAFAAESSMITVNPVEKSVRLSQLPSSPSKLLTAQVTETFEIPSKKHANVAELIADQGFEMSDEIGKGAFASVYKAKRLRNSALVAAKVMDLSSPTGAATMKNELFVLERLSERGLAHPHVIKIYKHFVVKTEGKRQVFIFMALAEGGCLSNFVKQFRSGQPEDVCKRWFAQIVSAVGFMHSKGIVHRDLKLGNCLLDRKESSANVWVTDFGLSRVARKKDDTVVKSSTFGGTQQYMAPEILMIREYPGDYDPFPADIWALGVILHFLVNREYPFHNMAATIETQLVYKFKYGPRCAFEPNPQLTELFAGLFNPVPTNRISMTDLLKHSWFAKEMAQVEETIPRAKPATKTGEESFTSGIQSSTTTTKLVSQVTKQQANNKAQPGSPKESSSSSSADNSASFGKNNNKPDEGGKKNS